MAAMLFLLLVLYTGYFVRQSEFGELIVGFSLLFTLYLFLVFKAPRTATMLLFLMAIAFLARLGLIFSFPALSDDIYRFIWDGKLLHDGIHPLEFIPRDAPVLEEPGYRSLFPYLNSQQYHTVYPLFHQLGFYISTIGEDWSVMHSAMILKAYLLIFELLVVFYMIRMLIYFNINSWWVLIYILNPLVLIELTGNAHFEGVMTAFVLLFLFNLFRKKHVLSGIFLACAVATKLLPLIFLPATLVFLYKNEKAFLRFISSFFIAVVILFIPLLLQVDPQGFISSLDLYFRKFEFNASLYYILREVGEWLTGYNQIAVIGPLLAFVSVTAILYFASKCRNSNDRGFLKMLFYSFIVYLICSTTVHPWYLILPLALSVFMAESWMILWSFLIILSYGHYYNAELPQWLLLATEYGLLAMFIWWQKKYPPNSSGGYFNFIKIKRN